MVDDLSLLQFIEQRGVCDAAVFDDLAHAVREIGIGQRGERFRIGEDEARLMERADKVFTERQIDTRFAADTGIYLRQKGRRHLHEINAAQERCRREATHIARYAAAERDNDVAAREIVFRKRFVNLHDGGKLLLRLAGFKDELRRVDTRFFKRSF